MYNMLELTMFKVFNSIVPHVHIAIVCVLLCFVHVCSSGTALERQEYDNQLFCMGIMCKTNSFGPINNPYPYL